MNNQTPLCRYTYDPLDRLASSAQNGQPISQCFYQAGQLQGEIQGSANRMLMCHGNQLLAQRDQTQGQTDQQLLASDRQHSVLHAAARRSQHAIAYSPYGHRATDSGLTQLANFTGERLDPVTGHYLLGNGYRSFNPVLMRFNSPDSLSPFGEGGLNAYAYCLGDPVNYRDPDGHVPGWLWPVAGIALSIVGIVASAGAFAAATPVVGVTGFAAQWGALTAAAKVSVGLSVASGVTGVGSGAASLAEPESSTGSILGYVSLGLGVLSAVAGGGAYALAKRAARGASRKSSTIATFEMPPSEAGRVAAAGNSSFFNEPPVNLSQFNSVDEVERIWPVRTARGVEWFSDFNHRPSIFPPAPGTHRGAVVTSIEDITDQVPSASRHTGNAKNLFRRRLS